MARESGWAGEEEYPGYQGEEEYPGYQGEEEYPGYQGEEEYPGYRAKRSTPATRAKRSTPAAGQGEEEQFLPALIPIVGQVLGGPARRAEAEGESEAGYGEGEDEYPRQAAKPARPRSSSSTRSCWARSAGRPSTTRRR